MISDGAITEFTADRQRVRRKRSLQRQRAVKASEKKTRLFRIEDCLFHLSELAACKFKNRPLATVRGYANKMLALLAFSVAR